MGAIMTELIRILLIEEIRRVVADAVEDRAVLSVPDAAAQIERAYPNSGLTDREIAGQIMAAATDAGVAVESGQSRAA
jgi:hypothetical protein